MNQDDDDDDAAQIVGLAKRRRGGQTNPEQSKDEQAIPESALNKLVGAADVYNLEVTLFFKLLAALFSVLSST